MVKKKVLILSFTNHLTDPRVFRQIEALHKVFEVTTAGTSESTHQQTTHVQIVKQRYSFFGKLKLALSLKVKLFESAYWKQPIVSDAMQKLSETRVDVIIANDLETLPLALELSKDKKTKVYLDAHEYSPREFEGDFKFDFFFTEYTDYLCRTYLTKADAMTTVCQGIADEYHKVYGVNCDVISNAPEFIDLVPYNSDEKRIKIIHHGGVNASRKIENMIQLVGERLKERFDLDLMLMNNYPSIMSKLQALVDQYENVRIIPPVPMPEIAQTVNKYDVGLYMLPPEPFNNFLALPNKIFEYMQARLAIAIWPSPEMARLVQTHELGVVAEEFTVDAMEKALAGLTKEKVNFFKQNSHVAAEIHNAENNAGHLKHIISELCQ